MFGYLRKYVSANNLSEKYKIQRFKGSDWIGGRYSGRELGKS